MKEDNDKQEGQSSSLDASVNALAEVLVEVLPPVMEKIASQPPRRWLPPDEAAAYMGISKSYLYELTAEGVLPCCQNGRKRIYDKKDLDAFWRKRKAKENPHAEVR